MAKKKQEEVKEVKKEEQKPKKRTITIIGQKRLEVVEEK